MSDVENPLEQENANLMQRLQVMEAELVQTKARAFDQISELTHKRDQLLQSLNTIGQAAQRPDVNGILQVVKAGVASLEKKNKK